MRGRGWTWGLLVVAAALRGGALPAQPLTVQSCPGGRCPVGQVPAYGEAAPAFEPPQRFDRTPRTPAAVSPQELADSHAGFDLIIWYRESDPQWREFSQRMQPGADWNTALRSRFGRVGYRNLDDTRNAPYAAAAGVTGLTIDLGGQRSTGYEALQAILIDAGAITAAPPAQAESGADGQGDQPTATEQPSTGGSLPPLPEVPRRSAGSDTAAAAACCDRCGCSGRPGGGAGGVTQVEAYIDARLQQIEQRLQITVGEFDGALGEWQALADDQTRQIEQLRQQAQQRQGVHDQRWEATTTAIAAFGRLQQRCDGLEQKLAACGAENRQFYASQIAAIREEINVLRQQGCACEGTAVDLSPILAEIEQLKRDVITAGTTTIITQDQDGNEYDRDVYEFGQPIIQRVKIQRETRGKSWTRK